MFRPFKEYCQKQAKSGAISIMTLYYMEKIFEKRGASMIDLIEDEKDRRNINAMLQMHPDWFVFHEPSENRNGRPGRPGRVIMLSTNGERVLKGAIKAYKKGFKNVA